MTDTPTNTNGWPDDAREALEWVLAIHFSQNRQPCMSGDPRDRLSPMQRRNMEDARDAMLEALAPFVSAREAAAAMAMRDAACGAIDPVAQLEVSREAWAFAYAAVKRILALPLPDTSALTALLAQAREDGRKEGDYHEGFEEGFKAGEKAEREAGKRAIEAEDEAIRARGEVE